MKRVSSRHPFVCLLALTSCPGPQPMMGEAPKISSTTPSAMATAVSPSTALLIQFSAAMDEASVKLTLTPTVALSPPDWNEEHTSVTFSHTDPLEFDTQYTVRVAGTGANGVKLGGDTVFAFTTATSPETTAPTLQSSTPAEGAMNVPAGTTLRLVFSEAMAEASLSVASAPSFDWGAPTWSAMGTTATFTPAMPLMASTAYLLNLSATDLAGNALAPTQLNFTVAGAADTTAPEVTSTAPGAGATGVSPNVQPSLSFSEPVIASSVSGLSVTPDAGCVATLDSAGTLLTCVRSGLLSSNTQYTVTLNAAAVKDLAMNPMAANFSFSFTTGSTPDNTAPTLVSMTPPDGGAGAPRAALLRATFSEPMDKASTQAAITVLSPANTPLTYAWEDAGTAVSMTTPLLPYGQLVTWQVGTGAKDLAGNALAAGRVQTFTVRRHCTGTQLRSDGARDGTASAVRSRYSFDSSGKSVFVGHTYSSLTSTSFRGMFVFPFADSNTGCTATAMSRSALAITRARLTASQTSVTGIPYPLGRAATTVDWVDVDTGRFDAGVLFTGTSPCRGAGCEQTLFSTNATGPRTIDVTDMGKSALSTLRSGEPLVIRLRNESAEADTMGTGYCTINDGSATTNPATLEVDYEYP